MPWANIRTVFLNCKKPWSVFVWGGEGLGKSSCVSLPSVLDMDNICLAIADSTGGLAKYSSAYRSRLGEVFYFNWALTDCPEKGEFWPRWNPLSLKDMPAAGEARAAYVKLLAKCLYPADKDDFLGEQQPFGFGRAAAVLYPRPNRQWLMIIF